MANPTLPEVLTDIKSRVSAIATFAQVHDEIPDSFSTPCAIVQPSPGDFLAYDPAMGSDAVDYRIHVTVIVAAADAVIAQANLYPYLAPTGASSIRAAIQGRNNSLSTNYAVEKATGLRPLERSGARYLACDLVVRVHA